MYEFAIESGFRRADLKVTGTRKRPAFFPQKYPHFVQGLLRNPCPLKVLTLFLFLIASTFIWYLSNVRGKCICC